MNIDLHSHFFPIEAFKSAGKFRDKAPSAELAGGRLTIKSGGGVRANLTAAMYDGAVRLGELDRMQINLQALSPSPIMLFYWDDPAAAGYFSRLQNEAIRAVAAQYPERFVGFGSAPLQDVGEAIAVAEHAKRIGLKGLEIGTAIGEKQLDDPAFEPFFDAAQGLDLLLFVHPTEDGIDMDDPVNAMLGNVVQFPYRTTLMIERLILKGLFEKYQNLRLCLSHGGGLLAFNIWRLDHAYGVRAELRKHIDKKPSEYLARFYYDTIVHSVAALEYLIRTVGADRVVIGTDYPMAMGDFDPVARIAQLAITADERRAILEGNAARALGIAIRHIASG
ncbi:MAG TPA: amidohydrolase family protein [Candidatus Binatia bacterium]|jgi:aminocarboxymuconate-semialdehyde decarboxylase